MCWFVFLEVSVKGASLICVNVTGVPPCIHTCIVHIRAHAYRMWIWPCVSAAARGGVHPDFLCADGLQVQTSVQQPLPAAPPGWGGRRDGWSVRTHSLVQSVVSQHFAQSKEETSRSLRMETELGSSSLDCLDSGSLVPPQTHRPQLPPTHQPRPARLGLVRGAPSALNPTAPLKVQCVMSGLIYGLAGAGVYSVTKSDFHGANVSVVTLGRFVLWRSHATPAVFRLNCKVTECLSHLFPGWRSRAPWRAFPKWRKLVMGATVWESPTCEPEAAASCRLESTATETAPSQGAQEGEAEVFNHSDGSSFETPWLQWQRATVWLCNKTTKTIVNASPSGNSDHVESGDIGRSSHCSDAP